MISDCEWSANVRNQAVLVEIQVFHPVFLKKEGGGALDLYNVFSEGMCIHVSISFVNFGLAQKGFQKHSCLKDI